MSNKARRPFTAPPLSLRWRREITLVLPLAGLVLLLLSLEHHLGLHDGTRAVRHFSLLPVLIGAALLRPVPLALLALFTLGVQEVEASLFHPLLENPEANLRLLGRLLTVGACVWISILRIDLQRSNQALKTQLLNSRRASALAHEIRQPLAVILLNSRTLLRNLEHQDGPDPAAAVSLGGLHEAAEQLDATTRAMAMLLRGDTLANNRVDLAAVVNAALGALGARLLSSGTQLQRQGTEGPLMVIGDAGPLEIACGNLLRNAIEALEAQQPSRRILRVSMAIVGERALLRVADSGPGLPCGLEPLLERSSGKPDGMGMGLWIVQTIAQHYGYALEADRCRSLGGAELRLNLPCAR